MHINNFSDSKRDLISKRTGIAFQRRVVGYQNDFIEIKLGVCLVAGKIRMTFWQGWLLVTSTHQNCISRLWHSDGTNKHKTPTQPSWMLDDLDAFAFLACFQKWSCNTTRLVIPSVIWPSYLQATFRE